MTDKPIRIYLDTSDLDTFKRVRMIDYDDDDQSQDKKLKEIYNYLMEQVNAENIVIGFSSIHLQELLRPYEPEYHGDRVNRARTIKALCGNYAWRHVTDIWRQDIKNIALGDPITAEEFALSSKREWGINIDYEQYARKMLDPYLDSLCKQYGLPSNHLFNRRNRIQFAQGKFPLFNMFSKHFINAPISKKARGKAILLKFMTGMMDYAAFGELLVDALLDPEELLDIVYEKRVGNTTILSTLDQLKETMRSIVADLEEQKYKEYDKELRRKFTDQNYKDPTRRHEFFLKILNSMSDEFTPEQLEEIKNNYSLDDFKSILNTFEGIYLLTQKIFGDGQDLKDGDAGDIVHLWWLPYCNLVRVDQSAFHTLKGSKYSNRFVSKLVNLPDRIEKLKNCRKQRL